MGAVQLGAELAERGITASAYPQTDPGRSPPPPAFGTRSCGSGSCSDDPELRPARGEYGRPPQATRWRIEAPDRSSNVDAIAALAMALDRFENQPEPTRLLGWL
jgi:hypothetical protein